MNKTLLLVMVLGACGGGRTEYFAVGATNYFAAPNGCTVTDNAGGAIVELRDHYKSQDGKGLVFQAAKVGTAKIDCGDDYSAKIVVREPVKIAFERIGAPDEIAVTGTYGPVICVRAYDKDGKQLELGLLVDGVEVTWSEHMSRVVDHGMGGPGNPACGEEQWAHKPGIATVTGTWRGMTTKAEVKIVEKKTI